MNSVYSINPKRLLLLIRSYLITNLNLILILAAVFLAITTLRAILDAFTENSPDLYNKIYFLMLYVSGFFITRRIGKELHDRRKGSNWILLPASTLEKFSTLLLLPTLILICGAALYMSILSVAVEQLMGIFISTSHEMLNPFATEFLKGLNIYISLQAAFLLGAIYFKKHGMSFTFLSFFAYFVILGVFSLVAVDLILGDYIEPMKNIPAFMDSTDKLYAMTLINKYLEVYNTWEPVISYFFSYVFPVICWITAFFSLKEMEL